MLYVILNVGGAVRERATYAIRSLLDAVGVGYHFTDSLEGHEEIVLSYGPSTCPATPDPKVWIQCPCCPWLLDPQRDWDRFGRIDQSIRYLSYAGRHLPFWGDAVGGRGDEWVAMAPRGKKGACRLRADLFGNVFFHLSRLEESHVKQRDRWGRFESSRSLLGKAGLLSRPIVDEYTAALGELLEQCCQNTHVPLVRKALWPHGEPSAVCLTHDVDRTKKWTWKRILYEMLQATRPARNGLDTGPKRLARMAKSVARGENPYWNFETLLGDEDEFEAISSFYFSTSRKVKYDPSYDITDDRIQQCIRQLRDRGREVGLHATYDAYSEYEHLSAEHTDFVRATGLVPRGLRFHYLRFDEGSTFRNADRLGLAYDSTLGYAAGEGFRAGTSLPFHPFDLSGDEPLELLEIPFCIMDKTLTDYQGYDAETALAGTRSIWEAVRRCRGLFSVLLHQASYDVDEYPYMRPWYRALLGWTRDENAFCATAEQMADWWRARTSFRLLEARREGSRAVWRFSSALHIKHLKLRIKTLTGSQPSCIEVKGCDHRVQGDEEAIGLALGPIERGKEILISVSC